jgi:rhodanese-related sulfurtransferase
MKNLRTKCIVAALILSMSFSAGLPAFAAEVPVQTASQTEQAVQTVSVKELAKEYFTEYPSDKHVVSAQDFLSRVDSDEALCVIDLRSAEDYAAGHIKGAVNVPYGVAVADALEQIPTDVPVLVYCYSGQTASQTIALLRLAGKDAYNVSGGFTGISKQEQAKALTVKTAQQLEEGEYPVDQQLKTAIREYYELAEKSGKFNMSAEKVKEAIAEGEVYLVDIRSENDYLKSRISGAKRNIPFGKGMQEELVKLPKDRKIVFQCYSGQTASQTVAALLIKGYTAYNLSGGMGAEGGSGWLGAGYELVK